MSGEAKSDPEAKHDPEALGDKDDSSLDRRVIVFLGPSLPVDEARQMLDADYRPPVAQGDVLRATDERPWAIAIVDGYFERVPAVWHKEILWAMAQGVHVFGAASMGALRAAELAELGMEGVGTIFDAYRSGDLKADDEVALIHAPESQGYRPGSEAMVNIRATLAAARDQEVISGAVYDALIELAKARFYPERTYEAILQEGYRRELAAEQLRRLEAWLPTGKVDSKRLDALAMLKLIAGRRGGKRKPARKQVDYAFQHTEAWSELCRSARDVVNPESVNPESLNPKSTAPSSLAEVSSPAGISSPDLRLDALQKRDARRLEALQEQAWSRIFGLELSRSHGTDDLLLSDAVAAFCRRRQLQSSKALDQWLNDRNRTYDELLNHIKENLKLDRLRRIHASSLPPVLRELAQFDEDETPT